MFVERDMQIEMGGRPHSQKKETKKPLIAEETPSWEKTAETLPLYQRIAAETSYASKLIPRIVADGESQIDWKRESSSYWRNETKGKSNKEVVSGHIAGILDAFNADPTKDTDFESNYYRGRLPVIETPELKTEKDKIFSDATTWDPSEQRQAFGKAVKSTRKALRPYGKDLLEYYLKNIADIPEEQVNNVSLAETRLRRKSVLTAAINTGLVAISYGAGKASVDLNVMNNLSEVLGTEQVNDPKVLGAVGAATFAAYYGAIAANGFENDKLLKMKGISTIAPSKAAFDRAPENYKSLAGAGGYAVWHTVSELPIALGANEAYQDHGWKGFGDYSIGANITSGLLWLGIWAGTKVYRKNAEADGLEELLSPKKERPLFSYKKAKEAKPVVIDLEAAGAADALAQSGAEEVDFTKSKGTRWNGGMFKQEADIVAFPTTGEEKPGTPEEPLTDGSNALDMKEMYSPQKASLPPTLRLLQGE